VDWIHVTQDWDRWWVVVNMVINHQMFKMEQSESLSSRMLQRGVRVLVKASYICRIAESAFGRYVYSMHYTFLSDQGCLDRFMLQ
jgi:hypothetical protein